MTAPNQVWVGDVTYVWAGNQWSYLAVVIDLFARKPVSWTMSYSPDSQLTGKALEMAYESRGKPSNVLFQVIKAVIIRVRKYRQAPWRYQIKQILSRRGNCWDNNPMKRFFRSLKTECVPACGYLSLSEAWKSIVGLTPSELERQYWEAYKAVANFC
ncbi:DDE-type integrase/transposase/recombinase [Vibrio sp. WXL210]|uniref:DDE-type integrase/transposase/recombinase n=1 Tax=Vibrio sp. WXL210 TaxID=3450709 RepID=UPI003EC87022